MSDDTHFGLIQPTLIQQIKKILDEYPDDGQILKELIQNAEDAGATEVKFLIDHNSYPTENLHHPELAKFQGPALYAYNNAKFTSEDWKGIGMLCESIKVNDPTKVGRFGLGFKSVFHMTDLPSVISCDSVGIIDPHERYFSDDNGKRSGMRWKLNNSNLSQDQFAPYKDIFDCTEGTFHAGSYEGTLFRLPFRRHPSKLSDTIYEENKIRGLLESFKSDSYLILLFLMNLERIEVYERKKDRPDVEQLFSVFIPEDYKATVQAARQRFKSQMEPQLTGDIKETYPLTIHTYDYTSNTTNTSSFAITHLLSKGSLSTHMEELKDSLSYMPRVGIAFPLETAHESTQGSMGNSRGHVFCFLPLPLETKSLTGLPVHVNGFFALSQNRRHLKWRSTDQTNTTDKSLLWNEGLLHEVLPKAYAELIFYLVAMRLSPEVVYAAWPDPTIVDVKWKPTAESALKLIVDGNVFYTYADGGSWCRIKEAALDTFGNDNDIQQTVVEVLNRVGQKVVTVPGHVRLAIKNLPGLGVREITPGLVSALLKGNHQHYVDLPRDRKLFLLSYILSDSGYSDLEGLQLLPLANKTFAYFKSKWSKHDVVYIASAQHPKSLLPGMDKIFLDSEIDEDTVKHFRTAVQRGFTQLCHFDTDAVKKNLHKVLPPEWTQQSKAHVTWYPGQPKHPPRKWLDNVWQYLNIHFNYINGLNNFYGIPLVPIHTTSEGAKEKILLGRLQKPSSMILSSFNGECLESSIKFVASAIGVIILENVPEFILNHRNLMPDYINPPRPKGLLAAFNVIDKSNPQAMAKLDARSLSCFFAQMTTLTQCERNLLNKLKLFETCVINGNTHPRPVSRMEVSLATPVDDLPPVRLCREMLNVRCNSDRSLAQLLGIEPLKHEELVKIMLDHALQGQYTFEEIDGLVKYTMDRFGLFSASALQLINQKLKALPFVTSADGSKKKVEELFDPEDYNLSLLFLNEPDKFPRVGSRFSSPDVLLHLRTLGLKKQQDVTRADILYTAKMIKQTKKEAAIQKSTAILNHLENNSSLLNKSLLNQLFVLEWVPVHQDKPKAYPNVLILENQKHFACPKDVTSVKYRYLVGSLKPLVDDSRPNLSKTFGWNNKPSIRDVISHLKKVTTRYKKEDKNNFVIVIKEVYRYLAEQSVDAVQEMLNQDVHKWIWNGDGFCSTSEVIENESLLNLKPYLYPLPSEVREYAAFFVQCGVKRECDTDRLLEILQKMREEHSKPMSRDEVKRDLQYTIEILNALKPNEGEKIDANLRNKLLVPVDVEGDSRLELIPVDECTYCDREWLKQGRDASDIDDVDDVYIKFIHRNISSTTSEELDVPPLVSRILDADELDMGEMFGQYESLLDRLKSLLEGYTDGLSVPKELIQNADDAGATEVRFLFDERTNDDALTQLIDEAMKECQGPALWSYNNAVFTEKDFEDVVKLNAATKKDDTGKIGRFGLGFNSVYNLTDVPSFVSKEFVVLFDPHTSYLGKAIRDKSKPGIKINTKKKKFSKLQNQFKPYNGVFGCDLSPRNQDKAYNGTLFRLPLRTARQAASSKIKNLCYDSNQVKDLFRILLNSAESLLLFTQNVIKVRVFHLRSDARDPSEAIELLSISKSCEDVIHRLKYEGSLPEIAKRLSDEDQELIVQSSVLKASTALLKGHTLGTDTTTETLMKSSMVLSSCCTVSEHGRDFLDVDEQHTTKDQSFWLVHSCMVGGRSLCFSKKSKVCTQEYDVVIGILPTAGVAAKLKTLPSGKQIPSPLIQPSSDHALSSSDSYRNLGGNVFSFLPLPIHSGLQVHINGCFSVDDSRRHLRERTEDDKADLGAKWNSILMSDVVVPAYIGLLQDARDRCLAPEYGFHTLWPVNSNIQNLCRDLVKSFYQRLVSNKPNLDLFSDGTKWSSIQGIAFLDPSFRKDDKIGDIAFEVLKNILWESRLVIDMPEEVLLTIQSCGLEVHVRELCYDKTRFFHEVFFPCICDIEESQRNNLVLYAIDVQSPDLLSSLRNYQCIPSSPDGAVLKCPNNLVHPHGKAAKLFEPSDGRFPHGKDFCTGERLLKLKILGMCEDDLEWEEVLERAKSVTLLKPCEKSLSRTKILLEFIHNKLDKCNGEVDNNAQEELKQIPFLAFMSHPKSFPSKWKGDEYEPETLHAANDLYPSDKKYLVGASELILNDKQSASWSGYFYSNVKQFLGLGKKVSIDHLKQQMQSVIETGSGFQSSNSEFTQELSTACSELYSCFQYYLRDSKDEVVTFLAERPFILGHSYFFKAVQVAFSSHVEFEPFITKVRPQFAIKFKDLLQSVGVKSEFTIQDYIDTLRDLFDTYKESSVKMFLTNIAAVLDAIESLMKKENLTFQDVQEKYGTIYVPDSKCVMRPSGEICINDWYWMDVEDEEVKYAHDKIPVKVCYALGVNSRRQEALRNYSFSLDFGQSEKLTNRLKRLLTGYTCDGSIMKELLQNADDAKATKVCFIKDARCHPDERVFEESWKPLQGPALCVYNDAPFTENDIKGIQNLGEGTKGHDPNKTGQYGVGFNAVYHLTDAPSFLSKGEEIGEVMCVFDPNLNYVPWATENHPGRRYTDLPKLRKNFADVFPCYLEDQLNLHQGTVFRFPLRTEVMAEKSSVCKSVMTLDKLDKLLHDFQDELMNTLLFVNNVKEISICELDESGNLKELYNAKASLNQEDAKKRDAFASCVKYVSNDLCSGRTTIDQVSLSKVSYVLDLTDSKGICQKWLVNQQIGFSNSRGIPNELKVAHKKGDLGLLPRGGVAVLVNKSRKETTGNAFCFLPLPFTTGLPVHVNGHFALDHEARRNLWKSEVMEDYRSTWNQVLSQDVIASCYLGALIEVRKHISLVVIADNKTFLQTTEEEAKAILLKFSSYFPILDACESPWKEMASQVYQEMNARKSRLLPVIRQNSQTKAKDEVVVIDWLPPTGQGRDKALFDDLPTKQNQPEASEKRKHEQSSNARDNRCQSGNYEFCKESEPPLRDILRAIGVNLVSLPEKICKCFMASNVLVDIVSPLEVINFFATYHTNDRLCNIGELPQPIQGTPFKDKKGLLSILSYLKKEETLYKRLNGLPLLLTEDGNLRVFDESQPVFRSGSSDLVPKSNSQFLQREVMNRIFPLAPKPVESPVFKSFDITAFGNLIPKELQASTYKSNHYIEWDPLKNGQEFPNKTWICHVWRFLSTEIETLVKNDEAKQIQRKGMDIPRAERQKMEKESKKAVIENAFNPVMDWCLLPAVFPSDTSRRQRHILVPPVLAFSLIKSTSSVIMNDLKAVLSKLTLPEINSLLINSVYSIRYSAIPEQLVATLEDPTSIVKVLLYKLNVVESLQDALTDQECHQVLEYFSKHLESIDEDVKPCLKKLPFYVTTNGRKVSIENKKVFVLSKNIPEDGIHSREKISVVFLEKNRSLEKLYTYLGCDTKDEVDVYCDEIFPRFGELNEAARLKHLKFVRELFDDLNIQTVYSKEMKEVIERKIVKLRQALVMLKFLPNEDGVLQQASSFFDPTNEVFKVMFEKQPEMFPREPFCEKEWLLFLRNIGLTYEVTHHQFLQFAQDVEIESRSHSLTDSTKHKSTTLISCLFKEILGNPSYDKQLDGTDKTFHFSLSKIRFLCPDEAQKQLQDIHSHYGMIDGRLPYICFKESVVCSNRKISWTSANLLPRYANPSHHIYSESVLKDLFELLGILQKPTVDMVITHCQNICCSLSQNPDNTGMGNNGMGVNKCKWPAQVVDIMKEIYEFLLKAFCNPSDQSDIRRKFSTLKDTSCLVIEHGNRLIYPYQAAVDLRENEVVRPYLFQYPLELGQYIPLFKHLGTTISVTPEQYAVVLRMIHDESKDTKLLPNELTSTIEAIKGLFRSLKETKDVTDVELYPLYLPGTKESNAEDATSRDAVSRLSSDILYNDAPRFKDRITRINAVILLDLNKAGLEVSNDEDFIDKLPKSLRPRKLSALLREKLVDENQSLSRSEAAIELNNVLTHSNFCHGIIRMIKHVNFMKHVETCSDILTTIKKHLSCIQVHSAISLRTRLIFHEDTIPDSEADVTCFEELTQAEDGQEIWKIFIQEGSESLLFSSRVAEIVSRIAGRPFDDLLVHLPIMLSLDPNNVKSFLDMIGIREDNALPVTTRDSYLPGPGTFMHVDDHHLLVHAFIIFYPGDFVGYELDDPVLRDESGEPTYIYAIVVEDVSPDKNSPPEQRSYKINVGTAHEYIEVNAVDLYQIYRPKQVNNNLELEQHANAATTTKQDVKPNNFEDVEKLIRLTLENAWKLPEEQKKKIIKRLMLTWHPDKNPDNEEFCTEVFKFLLSEIERLERGLTPNQARNYRSSGYTGYSGGYSSCFTHCKSRAEYHRSKRNTYYSTGHSSWNSGERRRWHTGGNSTYERNNPQPAEAARWYRQAIADLAAADNDVMEGKPSYEWACFKCHQAAEKALKAAQFSINADTKTTTHNLPLIAVSLGDNDLLSQATSLENLLGNSTRMRYPDRVMFRQIPNDVYTEEMATKAIKIALQILEIVKTKFVH